MRHYWCLLVCVAVLCSISCHAEDIVLGILPDEAHASIASNLLAVAIPSADCATYVILPGGSRKRDDPPSFADNGDFAHVAVCKTQGAGSQYFFKSQTNDDAQYKVPLDCSGTGVFFSVPLKKKYAISGTVTNSQTLEPVAGVNVSVASASAYAITNSTGQYTIAGLPSGSNDVSVDAKYFTSVQQTFDIADTDINDADFALTWTFDHNWQFAADWQAGAALHLQLSNGDDCTVNVQNPTCDCGGAAWQVFPSLGVQVEYIQVADISGCDSTSWTLSVYSDEPFVNFAGAQFYGNEPGIFDEAYPSQFRTTEFTIEMEILVAVQPATLWRWRYYGYGFGINGDGSLSASVCPSGNCYGVTTPQTNLFNDGLWHHVAFTRRSNVSSIFVDGVSLVSEATPEGSDIYFEGYDRVAIGGDGTAGNFYTGNMRNVRFWNYDRSASIFASKSTTISVPVVGLQLNVHFDGAMVDGKHKDYSGNNLHVTCNSAFYPIVISALGSENAGELWSITRNVSDVWGVGTWNVYTVSGDDGTYSAVDTVA